MAIGSGMAGQIGYAVETVAGTAVTVTKFVPLVKETLKSDRGRVESEANIASRRVLDAGMWNGGNIDVGGDVQHELYNKNLGALFTGLFGTVGSTSGPVSSLYTHTWPAVGEPKPLTIQKGVPGVAGVVHPFTYAGSMIAEAEFACKAGEIVTFGATTAAMTETGWRTVSDGVTTNASAAITSATAAWTADDVGKPISGVGIAAATTILSVQSATNATLSANATASGTSIVFTIGIALAAASYPAGLAPFKYTHGSILLGGSAVPTKELSINIKNGLDTDRFFIGRRTRSQPIEAGKHEITGSLDIEFTDRTQYNRFVYETQHALVIGFTNSLGESVTWTMNVRLDGETPGLDGRGIVPQSIPWKAVGTTDAAAFSVVVVSTDVTP